LAWSTLHRTALALLVSACVIALAGCPSSDPSSPFGPDTIVKGTRVQRLPLRNRLVHPPSGAPSLTYWGGPVLANVKVVEVEWGTGVSFGTELAGFYGALVKSEYFDLLAEYSTPTQTVGRGGFEGLTVDDAAPEDDTIDDGIIQTELARLIHDQKVPVNDADTFYVVHFPPSVTITQGGASSCLDFCGYHGTFKRNGQLVPYAVVPDMGGACSSTCGGANAFANTTWVAAHELAGAVTDPGVGFAPTDPGDPLGWFDPNVGEMSDLCQGTAQLGGRWVVQTQWSMKDGKCRFGPSATGTFVLGVSPATQTVKAGTSATLLVATTATAPGAGTIALAVSGLPEGVTASIEPASVAAGGSAVVTLAADATAPSGAVDVTVSGTAGDETESNKAHLTVQGNRPANDFSIGATPVSQTVRAGQTVKVAVKTMLVSGTAETITLSASGLPDGVTAAFNPPQVAAGGATELTLSAAASAPAGSALVMITGTARSRMHTATVSLDVTPVPPVNDFAVAVSPPQATFVAGQGTSFNVTTQVTSGNPQTITLSVSGLPAGVTGSFTPPTVSAGGASQLTLSSDRSASATGAPFTIGGTAPSGTHTTTASVTITPAPPLNDFSVAVLPASRQVAAGSSVSFSVNTAVVSGSAVPVSLAISGLPSGVTASFMPAQVTAGGSATLTLSVALDAAVGSAPLTITGASGTGNHQATATLNVTAPPPPDFSIGVTPPSQTVTAGAHTSYVVATQVTTGAAQTISLSVTGLPTGVHGSFQPASVLAGDSSTLTLSADSGSSAAPTTFTVHGSATSGSHTATAQIEVTAPPVNDFGLGLTPGMASVQAGMSTNFTVQSSLVSGSAQSITLSVTGLPTGVSAQLDPPTITAGDSATLILSASSGAAATTTTFTVSGAAASGTHVAMGQITVTPAVVTGLITNGDFETGSLSGWSIESGKVVLSSSAHHGGSYSARVGYTDSGGYGTDSVLYQAIDVPSSGTTSLVFWDYPRCYDPDDTQAAYIADAQRQYALKTIFEGGCSDAAVWQQHTVDLTPWAGSTVVIYFDVQKGLFAYDNAWMYIDDVVVTNQP
jgi:hypothetical protein